MLTALVVTVAVLLVGGSVSAFVAYQRLNGKINHVNVDKLLGDEKDRPPKVAEDPKAKNILRDGLGQAEGQERRSTSRASARTRRSCSTSPPTGSRRSR